MGCCSLTFLLLPAFLLLGGVCSGSSLHLQLPLGTKGELSETLQVLFEEKKKLNIPGITTGEKDGRKSCR